MNHRQENRKAITRITLWGSLVNLLLSALKISAGLIFSSQSLVADGIHSLSDLITDAAILLGAPFWTAPPDEGHPYGHGRIETLVNGFIGLVLSLVALLIAWKSIATINSPHTSPVGIPVLTIALISILSKEGLYRWTLKTAHAVRSSALAANAWHHRSDALSSLPVAIAGLAGMVAPQIRHLDHLAALLVSIMLLKASARILQPALNELLETRTETALEDQVSRDITTFLPECQVRRLQIRRVGGALLGSLDLAVDPGLTIRTAHQQADNLQQHLQQLHPDLLEILIHMEPRDSEGSDPAL